MPDSDSEIRISQTVVELHHIRHVRVIDQVDESDTEAGDDMASNKRHSPTPRQILNYLGIPIDTTNFNNFPLQQRQDPSPISLKPDLYTGEGDLKVFVT